MESREMMSILSLCFLYLNGLNEEFNPSTIPANSIDSMQKLAIRNNST